MEMLVKKGISAQSISDSMTGTSAWGASAWAASAWAASGTNSPIDVEAASSVRFGRTMWKYWDGPVVKEGNITV